MAKIAINPKSLPVSPVYNRGIKVGNTIYIAGATARLTNGQIVGDGKDYALEVRTCLDNIRKVVEDGGGKMSDVVRLTCFMTDINFGAETGKAIQEAFPGMKPAVTGIVITSLGNASKNAHVEIEATAVIERPKKKAKQKKR